MHLTVQHRVAGFGVAAGVPAGRTACETQAATKRRPPCAVLLISRGYLAYALACAALAGLIGCGSLAPSSAALEDDDAVENACLDLWSLVHFGSGYYISNELGDDSLVPTVGVLVAYELIEPEFWPGFSESELNQQCDIAFGTLGCLVESLSSE